jgi:hypothetical protein
MITAPDALAELLMQAANTQLHRAAVQPAHAGVSV